MWWVTSLAAFWTWCCAAALLAAQNPTADQGNQQRQQSPSVNERAPPDFFRQSLGVQVVVVDQDQLNLPAARAGNIAGGLRIVQVVGPLAKIAGLKPGFTIVAIDDKPVTSLASARQALSPHHALVEGARLTMLRGDETIHAELLIAPPGDDAGASSHDPSTGHLTEADRQSQRLKSEYRGKVDLLTQELSEVEDLHAQLGMTKAQAEAAHDRRRLSLEEQQDQVNRRIVDVRVQLATLEDKVADRLTNHAKTNTRESEAELNAAAEQRDAAAQHLDEIEKTAALLSERLASWPAVIEELKQRRRRVQILQKGCANSVKQLRQLQAHAEDATENKPVSPAATQ
jgi:PDZ domain